MNKYFLFNYNSKRLLLVYYLRNLINPRYERQNVHIRFLVNLNEFMLIRSKSIV